MRKIVIFGASGDLSCRMLIPSLYNMNKRDIRIIAYGRSPLQETFTSLLKEFYADYTQDFLNKIKYVQGEYDDLSPLKHLTDEKTIFYFAVPPSVFLTLLTSALEIEHSTIAIEKPYGTSLANFQKITKRARSTIVFVDHYQQSALCTVLPIIKARDHYFYNFMNRTTIKSVSVLFGENIGAEGRKFFDRNGIIKDVMLTHLLQVFSHLLCTPAGSQEVKRLDVISALEIVREKLILGQYIGYETEMETESKTETFAMFPVRINVPKWKDVPVIFTAGKALIEKNVSIVMHIKKDRYLDALKLIKDEEIIEKHMYQEPLAIDLAVSFAPKNEISLKINFGSKTEEIFLYNEEAIKKLNCEKFRCLEKYELTFHNLFDKKSANFVSPKVAEKAWALFEPILDTKKEVLCYEQNSFGPSEALEFENEYFGSTE